MKLSEWHLKLKDSVSTGLSKINSAADNLRGKFTNLQTQLSATESKAKSSFSGIGSAMLATGAITGLSLLTRKVFDVTVETEKYNAVLTNSLGSAAAAADGMRMLQDFAKSTPYEIEELTGAFVKMVNRGLLPTQEQLRSMGDLAASSGKGLDQLTEALLDAQTGEFERLKEFGIKAKVEGDKVTFMFHNQATTIANNSAAISEYVQGLGNVKGVHGSMHSQMQTLGGIWSNTMDSVRAKILHLGEIVRPAFVAVFTAFAVILDNGPLIIDIFKGIILVLTPLSAIYTLWNINTIILTASQWLLNIALTANPIGVIIVLVSAIVTALVIWGRNNEKVRGTLTALWEASKQIFQNIAKIAMDYLGGVAQLMKGIWTFDMDSIKSGLSSLKNAFSGVKDIGKGVGEKWKAGFAEGAAAAKAKVDGGTEKPTYGAYDAVQKSSAAAASGAAKSAAKKGIDSVAGGGGQVRNITVHIGSLTKDVIIHASSVKEGMSQIRNIIQEELIRAIGGAEDAIA